MNNELIVKYKIGEDEIKLTPKIVQEYIVGTDAKITMPEFKLFTELCRVRKLNPFLREAYLIKYSDKQPASIVVGKDAIYKRAVLNSNFDGMESGVIVLDSNGVVVERTGSFKLPDDILVGGWAKVYRKDWQHPIYASVTFNECVQKKNDGTPNSNWTKQPTTMIEKVAKVRALREAFVEDLSGMYEAEEMDEVPQKETTEMTGKEKSKQVVIDTQLEEQEPETITFEEVQ